MEARTLHDLLLEDFVLNKVVESTLLARLNDTVLTSCVISVGGSYYRGTVCTELNFPTAKIYTRHEIVPVYPVKGDGDKVTYVRIDEKQLLGEVERLFRKLLTTEDLKEKKYIRSQIEQITKSIAESDVSVNECKHTNLTGTHQGSSICCDCDREFWD